MGRWKKHEILDVQLSALSRSDVDFGGSPAYITHARLEVARPLIQYWIHRSAFLFIENGDNQIRIDIFVNLFSAAAWYVTLISIIVSSIALLLLLRLQRDIKRSDFGLPVVLTISAICQQGYEYFPKPTSIRIAMLQIALLGLLLLNFFSGDLVSARLNNPPYTINDSLNELAKTNLKLITEKVPYFDFVLKVS